MVYILIIRYMPKIGRLKVSVPGSVKVDIKDDNTVVVSGPCGVLNYAFPKFIEITSGNDGISLSIDNSNIDDIAHGEAYRGLYRALLFNMILGVTEKFTKKLEIIGVGYKAVMLNSNVIEFDLGYSHKIVFFLPEGIHCEIVTEKGKNIVLSITGIDKYLVGQVAANIRFLRPVEPYKGKGIRYYGENVKLKVGKAITK